MPPTWFPAKKQAPALVDTAARTTCRLGLGRPLAAGPPAAQSLSAGVGEEVRLGRGFMFWRLELQLTEAGEGHVPHVLGTLARAIQVLGGASCVCICVQECLCVF